MAKVKYETSHNTPIRHIKKLLADARIENRIYVIANLVGILQHRGCKDVKLSHAEQTKLFNALQSIRKGKKVLAHWLPIGYETARFIRLTRHLTSYKVRVTERDADRIKRAAKFYRKHDNKHNRRQLRSLIRTAKDIGLKI